MKILIFLIFISASGYCQSICSSDIISKLKNVNLDSLTNVHSERINGIHHDSTNIYYTTRIDINNYLDGLNLLENHLDDTLTLTELDIYEFYDWHSLYQIIYFVAKANNGKLYLFKCEVFSNLMQFIGVVDDDYFGDLFSYVQYETEEGVGDSYISHLKIKSKGKINFEILKNTGLFVHNYFFIIEKVIKQEKCKDKY